MALDASRLRAFNIPDGHQLVSRRDCAFYALSIGFGHDPLDVRQLNYVDQERDLAVVPAMVLVLAHPGFWLANPASGVDPKAVLHGEQAFEILSPIPSEGLVHSRTRVTNISDKGPGKAAVVHIETILADETGTDIARLTRATFVRDGGGFGGSDLSPAARHAVPQGAPDRIVDRRTRPEQALLYRLNGDLNPIHSDPEVAAEAGFARPIMHGLCTMGVICNALLEALTDYDGSRLVGMSLRFSAPIYPGETVRTEIWTDGSFRARCVERDTIVVDNGVARVRAAASEDRGELLH